jgi:RND family efflux transporter MFP subunit
MMDDQPNRISEKTRRIVVDILLVALIVAGLGIAMRIVNNIKLRHTTEQQAILKVAVVAANAVGKTEEIVLPGNVQAWHEATIYARVNGYISKWDSDIGAHVKAGDLLAEIVAPELDAQLRQADADLITAEANNQLAQSTAARWQVLLKTHSVSKQETDEKLSSAMANLALVNAAKANRDRLRELVSFERVVAPFDGIITSRTTDIGSLINAGSGSSLKPLFHIAQADPLRVYVRVPQNYSASIKPGLVVDLYFSEHPGKVYHAKLLDSARAIDPVSRTLLTQFEVDNKNYQLLPGGYTEVHLKLPTPKNAVHIPVNTLLFRAEGLRVGVLDANNKVILKSIKIARDFGDVVEVDSGLTGGEKIIVNPSDSLFNGQQVQIVSSPAPAQDKKP